MNYEWCFSDDKPIYPQIVEQMERLIVSGELLPGDKLPSVLDLAREAQVNPNTMMRALSELENRELINSHRVNGKSVTEDTKLIKKGLKTIEQVPANLQAEVKYALKGLE